MIRPFLFITIRSFKNRVLSRARRLREPRYLIGFIAGLAYLWYAFVRRMIVSRQFAFALPVSQISIDVIACCALVALIVAWALPDAGGGLAFSEAEIQFLFPAPVSRRQLLFYKVLRQQPQIFFSAVMITIFGFRNSHFVGLWIAFVAMSVYFVAVSLARARLKLAGIGFLARLAAVAVALAATIGLFATELKKNAGALPSNFFSAGGTLQSPFRSPIVRAILFVPRVFASAVSPLSTAQFAVSCVALAAIAIVLLEAAARLNVAFEEASIEVSHKRAAHVARRRGGRPGTIVLLPKIRPPFRLRPGAGPEMALFWKNLIASLRVSVAWIAFLAVILSAIVLKMITIHSTDATAGSAYMLLVICALFPYVGSSIFTHDLRMDLARIEVLKTYPMTGERLIAAEIAAPLAIISLLQILLLVTATVLLQFVPDLGWAAFFATPQFVVLALLLVVPICAMQLLLRNASVILFPAWALRSAEESRGFAVMGQRLVAVGGMLVTITVALIPAALLFLPILLALRHLFGDHPAVFAAATMPAAAVLVVECWILLRFLGGQFETIDVTNEIGVSVI